MKKVLSIFHYPIKNSKLADNLVKKCYSSQSVVDALTNPTELAKRRAKSPVWTWNGWDTLQECIVGIPDNAVVPSLVPEVKAAMKRNMWPFFEKNGGKYWADVLPEGHWQKVQEEITELVTVMEGEGVKVVRPDAMDFKKEFVLPVLQTHGLYCAMPRDLLLVIGDEIIEASMAWRHRFFEYYSYRNLVKGYYNKGSKWTMAPRPLMREEWFDTKYDYNSSNRLNRILKDTDVCFDAADFARCGRDILGQRSQVTNVAAINWLRRHLAPQGIRVHELNFHDSAAMHTDATFVPVRPGTIIRNPNSPLVEQHMFKNCGWEIIDIPEPLCSEDYFYMTSKYLAINVLTMDKNRVFVEKSETGIQKIFESIGMKSIPVNLKHCFALGGGFHCWTTDIRRDGTLEYHFEWPKEYLEKYEEKYGS